MATERDYSAPPRTEFHGRQYRAEIAFCLTEDATEEEIEEWLAYELGGGGIACSHPLIDAELNRVSVTYLRGTGRRYYTDWGPTAKDGSASGKGRVEFDSVEFNRVQA